ncbi:MAG: hypothetical protein R2867_17120 [Caldilineaceae bacterium]
MPVLRKRRPVYRLAGQRGATLCGPGAEQGYDVPPFVIAGCGTDPTVLWAGTLGTAPGARGL